MNDDILKNEGNVDRIVRVVAGLAMLALYFVGPKTSWGLVGALIAFTGLVGTCPVYCVLGISTRPARLRGQ